MIILAVDDEKIALEGLVSVIQEAAPKAEIHGFRSAREALEFVETSPCDVAFLDIRLRGASGVELARQLKMRSADINIIFTTGYSEYSGEAFNLHASGYIMKPVTVEKIRQEMEDLRHPVSPAGHERLRVQAFGNFEVYVNDEPVQFRYSKTKELLAYLVDRNGALCSNRQLMAALWEETGSGKESYLQNIRKDMITTLREAGCIDALIRQPGKLGIQKKKLDCDYYDWLEGKPQAINAYRGEYMSQYSWAEFTLARLEMETQNGGA